MNIEILVHEGGSPSGLSLTLDAFDVATQLGIASGFAPRIGVVSPAAPLVGLRGGLHVSAAPLPRLSDAHTVIVIGVGSAAPEDIETRLQSPDLQHSAAWLKGRAAAGATVCAACTGVFVLGEAGLLKGKHATTTWWLAGVLARRYGAKVNADEMVVADSTLLTGGTATAHLDVALHLISQIAGPELARETASRMTGSLGRRQGEFVKASDYATFAPLVAEIERMVCADLERQVSVNSIAEQLGVSARTLQRQVRSATGQPTARLIQKIRLEAAIRIASQPGSTVAHASERIGMSDASVLQRLAVRHTGHSFGALRRRAVTCGSMPKGTPAG
jgi:transcriptional regulator GlxA family with amidase domain